MYKWYSYGKLLADSTYHTNNSIILLWYPSDGVPTIHNVNIPKSIHFTKKCSIAFSRMMVLFHIPSMVGMTTSTHSHGGFRQGQGQSERGLSLHPRVRAWRTLVVVASELIQVPVVGTYSKLLIQLYFLCRHQVGILVNCWKMWLSQRVTPRDVRHFFMTSALLGM